MSKFCPQCGKPISEDAKFCPACGAPARPVSQMQGKADITEPFVLSGSANKEEGPKRGIPNDIFRNGYREDRGIKEMFFNVAGRLNRKRYFLRSLVLLPVLLVAMLLIAADESLFMALGIVLYIAAGIPNILLSVRRCHDINHSGWFLLLALLPIGNIIIPLLLLFKKGTDGPNTYGADPLGPYVVICRDASDR